MCVGTHTYDLVFEFSQLLNISNSLQKYMIVKYQIHVYGDFCNLVLILCILTQGMSIYFICTRINV